MFKRKKHFRVYLFGLVLSSLALVFLNQPGNADLHALGPMNTGHELLTCEECHTVATGTLRQQLQMNSQYILGLVDESTSVGFNTVANEACIACHDRPDDDHAVYQFKEPKYSAVRRKVSPHLCNACHREHQGHRVSVEIQFCRVCHDSLTINNDSVSISHADLIKSNDWDSCMGCHDYHGNHVMKMKTDVGSIIPKIKINRYFKGGDSPYSNRKRYKAKTRRFSHEL